MALLRLAQLPLDTMNDRELQAALMEISKR